MKNTFSSTEVNSRVSEIIELGPSEVQRYRDLRLRGLREHPEAFGETAEGFEAKSLEAISSNIEAQARLGGFILAAVSASGELLGTVGLAVNAPGKSGHRSFLWGMYVSPEVRQQKVGSALIQELIKRAERVPGLEQVHLSVVTSNTPAISLYERMGFEKYGTDPKVIKLNGQYFDEHLMARELGRR